MKSVSLDCSQRQQGAKDQKQQDDGRQPEFLALLHEGPQPFQQ
jgi:hypothetical protein